MNNQVLSPLDFQNVKHYPTSHYTKNENFMMHEHTTTWHKQQVLFD